jgi:hypothetical protein
MTVQEMVAALWSMRRDVEINILFNRRLYDITRVTFEADLGEQSDRRATVLIRTGEDEEKIDEDDK